MKVLVFLLNNRPYSVPISDIREINRLVKCRQVEKASQGLLGMINFHGKTTPVFNLKKLLCMEPDTLGQKAMWLAVPNNGSHACLAFDKVCQFLDLDRQSIDGADPLNDVCDVEHIQSYLRIDDNLMPVLDVQSILRISAYGLKDEN